MARKLYNMVQVPLAADITAGATTITFTAPLKEWGEDNIATITAPDTLSLRVGHELMHVTAYTSGASTATVARGQEGSTATAHDEGDILRHVMTDLDIPDTSSFAPTASPTFTGEATAPSFQATGKTGATATPIRLAGGTASGAPVSGAHLKGEIVFDDAGVGYYCTVAGTPGTWVSFSGGGGGGGDVATDPIWDAAGDLVYGTGANTAARLAIGAALRVLRVNAGATAPEWADLSTLYAPIDAGRLLAYKEATASATYSTSSTSDADVDATNLVLTFTVPASGKVMCIWNGLSDGPTSNWTVRESTTTVADCTIGSSYTRPEACFIITGLTPGASKTYKWGFKRVGAGTHNIYTGGAGGTAGNAIMRVIALP